MKFVVYFLMALVSSGHGFAGEFTSTPAGKPIADELLTNQDGQPARFYSEVIRGKRVVINFMFTKCTMICPPISAVSAKLAKDLNGKGDDARVVSISIDPESDTPDALKAHRGKYLTDGSAAQKWSLLTGDRAAVYRVLNSLGVASADMGNHEPIYIVGDDKAGKWKVIRGVASSNAIQKVLKSVSLPPEKNATTRDDAAFKKYFTDTELTDQSGRKLRIYTDLLKGHKVLVHFGFTRCKAVCSPAVRNLAAVQKTLGDKMESEYRILTFTVDPDHDTPQVLKQFAEKHGAGKGWYFLTGRKHEIETVLKKIGGWTEIPDNHTGVLMYGDVDHGIWSKSSSMDSPREIAFAISNLSAKNVF